MISVILPTRDPHPHRLQQTLAGLAGQTLPREAWELVIVDNGSSPPLAVPLDDLPSFRTILEPVAGLTRARLAGLRAMQGEIAVFVDDDNVLSPNFLSQVRARFTHLPRLGAAGGPVAPDFEQPPPNWASEFFGLLALRELGPHPIIATGKPAAPWPTCAPVGAGLCVRREAAELYVRALADDPTRLALDRTGRSLASGGDNDLIFTVLHAGWDVGYFPELLLTHIIPASRLAPDYLARLNQGIMRTWVRVLHLHGQCPWPAIASWTLPARMARAWWRFAAWRSPAHYIRWRGAVGQFKGQADLSHATTTIR